MIKLQALENFTLKKFDELQNIQRAGADTKGRLNKNDIFECNKELADYLLGNNAIHRAVVKLIEVEPEKVNVEKVIESAKDDKEFVEPIKSKKKKTSKK